MVTSLLLDTNVVSEVVRPRPDPHVLARLVEAEGSAALSVVTWHELGYGIERLPPGARRRALQAFVDDLPGRFPLLPYDRRAAEWHARERARLERDGRAVPFADAQIAATAAVHGLELVTRNVEDFRHFDLAVGSWWSA